MSRLSGPRHPTAAPRLTAIHGAVFYPPIGFCARARAPIDMQPGRVTTLDAAFIALAATKMPAADVYGRKAMLVVGWLIGLPVPFTIAWGPSWGWRGAPAH